MIANKTFLKGRNGNVIIPKTVTSSVYIGSSISSNSVTLDKKISDIDFLIQSLSNRIANLENNGALVLIKSISLKESLSVKTGSSVKLDATVSPTNATNKFLRWDTTNENIAKVSQDGIVEGVADGVCVITAQSQDGSDKVASCNVTVSTDIEIPEEPNQGVLPSDEYLVCDLDATGVLNGTMIWESSTGKNNATLNNLNTDSTNGFANDKLTLKKGAYISINPLSDINDEITIALKGNNTTLRDSWFFGLKDYNNGLFFGYRNEKFAVSSGKLGGAIVTDEPATLEDYNVYISINNNTKKIKVFKEGVLVKEISCNSSIGLNSIVIGKNLAGNSNVDCYQGVFSRIKIYNKSI